MRCGQRVATALGAREWHSQIDASRSNRRGDRGVHALRPRRGGRQGVCRKSVEGIGLRPAGDYKESLSFRLYIVGQGNHELKLPLDGKSGRPTLKGGKPHNIAETYNVKTGLEAIFIDGEMLVTYQYPAGSKVLSAALAERINRGLSKFQKQMLR